MLHSLMVYESEGGLGRGEKKRECICYQNLTIIYIYNNIIFHSLNKILLLKTHHLVKLVHHVLVSTVLARPMLPKV